MEELILKEQEIRIALEKMINDSKLPAIVLIPIFQEALQKLQTLKTQQYEKAKREAKK